MKLVIFGATGGTGRELVSQALETGHQVTAFVRNPAKLTLTSPGLRMVQGNVMDKESVQQALEGQDAVLCTLGAPAGNGEMLRSKGTQRIIQAMEKSGPRRLICLSSFGCGESRRELPFLYKHLIGPFILHKVFADHEAQEELLKASRLNWIAARPGALTNGKRSGDYWHGLSRQGKAIRTKISRADVADFMLRQLEDDRYLRQAPILSYA